MNVKITDYPYRYKAFNLNVFSQLPVAGLAEHECEKPDIIIREGVIPEAITNPLNKGVLFQAGAEEFLLKVDGLAKFYVQKGETITVEITNKDSGDDISAFILGTVFGALLHQRRLLPLHGSAVLYQEKGIVFSGNSGAGKSTIAAAFLEKGAQLLADDISLIGFNNNEAQVIPAFPGMKIWEDSLKVLGKKPDKYNPIRKNLKKYLYPVETFHTKEAAISHIFIIGTHNLETFEIAGLQGIEKFNALKNNTYFFRGMNKTGILEKHFQLCNMLAPKVKITRIVRPNGGFMVEKLAEIILEKLAEN
ncbi:MAG: hypothetical protein JXB00_20525 [Bacteroidales bacterium]|nr:hypothetical protein [Bacteroidales bacterium]